MCAFSRNGVAVAELGFHFASFTNSRGLWGRDPFLLYALPVMAFKVLELDSAYK